MTTTIRRAPTAAACALVATLLTCIEEAGAASIWIPPVYDEQTGSADQELTRALRLSLAINSSPDASLMFRDPDPARCDDSGCDVLRITGRRSPAPSYTIKRLGNGRARVTTLSAPSGTSLMQLADALAVKCWHLVARVAVVTPAAKRKVEQVETLEEPPLPVSSVPRPLVHRVDIGPALMAGLDNSLLTFGVELAGTFRLGGPISLRATVGYQSEGEDDAGYDYQTLPLTLMLGAWWSGDRSWEVGGFGGLAMTAVWIEFDDEKTSPATSEVAVGFAAEGRAAMPLHRRVWLGLSVRVVYNPGEVEVEVSGEQQPLYSFPHVLLVTSLSISLAF